MRNIDSCVNFLKSSLFLKPEKSADRRPSALRTCTWIVPWVDFEENHLTSSQPTPLPWPTPCRSKITFVSVSFHFIQCYYILRDNLLFCFCTACTPSGCDGKEEVQIALSVHCSRIVSFAKNMPKSSHQVVTKIPKVSSPPALPLSASTGRGSPQVPRLSGPPAHCEGSKKINGTL